MMKSVALTESLFVHSDDTDYVVVDVPAFTRNNGVIHVMTSVYDEGNDDSSLDDDVDADDDASYDYCDEFLLTQVKLPNEPSIRNDENDAALQLPMTPPVEVPFEVELSFVADDDVGSVCPPSITEDDTTAFTGITDRFDEEQEKNVSDFTTSSIHKEVCTDSQCIEDVHIPFSCNSHPDAELVTECNKEDLDSTDQKQNAIGQHQPTDEKLTPTNLDSNDEGIPSADDINVTATVTSAVTEIKNTTKDDGEWIETSSSRLSNKKRRKQMKLAKRAAAIATLSSASTSHPNTKSVRKVVMHRRCGGKPVAPILTMNTTVFGM